MSKQIEEKFHVERSITVDAILSSPDYKDKTSDKLQAVLSRANAKHKLWYDQQKELEKLQERVKSLQERVTANFQEKQELEEAAKLMAVVQEITVRYPKRMMVKNSH